MAIYKLGDICKIKRGSSPRPISGWLTTNDGLQWAKISDLKNNEIHDTKEFVDISWKKKGLIGKEGDLFLTNSATPGVPFIQKSSHDIAYHDGFLSIKPNEKMVLKKYLLYKLIIDRVALNKMGSGAVFINLSSKIVSEWNVCIPDINEQQKIIDIIKPIEQAVNNIKNVDKYVKSITTHTRMKSVREADYKYIKGALPNEDDNGQTAFLNVSAANNKINRYVTNEPNVFIGDVTLSLDGNTGLVNNSLEGYNGYLYKVESDIYKNYQIYYSLKHKINQNIIKINETGTTIKHSPNSKKQIKHISFKWDQIILITYELEIASKKLLDSLEAHNKKLINLLICN